MIFTKLKEEDVMLLHESKLIKKAEDERLNVKG